MTPTSAARAVLASTVLHRLESALFRTPVSDPAAIARITGPGVVQVMDGVDGLVAAAVAEALAVQAAEHTVESAAKTAQTLEGTAR
jgi:hypothetical protein